MRNGMISTKSPVRLWVVPFRPRPQNVQPGRAVGDGEPGKAFTSMAHSLDFNALGSSRVLYPPEESRASMRIMNAS